ncbi:MAG TPA: hypothetical protein VFQ72_01070 [Candidatus Paceibacterota bacterium]|nr:hypothetical protein [Candidatus Paceibacterota bacterium]
MQEKFLETLSEVSIVSYACKKHGISRQTYYRWRAHEEWFAILADAAILSGDEVLNDVAEMGAFKKVEQGDWKAIQYWLSRRHPKFKQSPWYARGFAQEQEEDPIRTARKRREAEAKVREWVNEWEAERKRKVKDAERMKAKGSSSEDGA